MEKKFNIGNSQEKIDDALNIFKKEYPNVLDKNITVRIKIFNDKSKQLEVFSTDVSRLVYNINMNKKGYFFVDLTKNKQKEPCENCSDLGVIEKFQCLSVCKKCYNGALLQARLDFKRN